MKWDEWRYNRDNNRPVFFIKHLFNKFGFRVNIHKMVNPDDRECFHTHPAHAIRIILWGGYTEEWMNEEGIRLFKKYWPLTGGWVTPEYTHRIDELNNGKSSYSLWIRFRKVAKIELIGEGWKS